MQFLNSGNAENICVLSQLKPGETGTVELIGRNVDAKKIPEVGQMIVLKTISLDKTMFTVEYNGKKDNMPVQTAENIWVTKC